MNGGAQEGELAARTIVASVAGAQWTADDTAKVARAINAAVAAERERLLDCARYDALMEGPKFMAWDRSALDRLRKEYEAAISNRT